MIRKTEFSCASWLDMGSALLSISADIKSKRLVKEKDVENHGTGRSKHKRVEHDTAIREGLLLGKLLI